MKRIAALEFAEHQRFDWMRIQKEYYKESEDWTIYTLPPIILLDNLSFDSYISIPSTLVASSVCFDGEYSYLKIDEDNIKGLFISKSNKAIDYHFPKQELKPTKLLLIEIDDNSFRIIGSRALSMDKDKK